MSIAVVEHVRPRSAVVESGNVGECPALVANGPQTRQRHGRVLDIAYSVAMNDREPILLSDGKRAAEYGIREPKHRRRHSNPERENANGAGGESRIPAERSRCVSEVATHVDVIH
jgi:hypothetical protein